MKLTSEQLEENGIELKNDLDLAEMFFSKQTGKFHIMLNAKMIFGSKSFTKFNSFAQGLIKERNLQF